MTDSVPSEPKVLYLTRFLQSYRVPILEQLNDSLAGGLTVCCGQPPEGSSFVSMGVESASFPIVELKSHWIFGERIHFQNYRSVLAQFPDASVLLLEESPRSIHLPLLLRRARKKEIGTVLWGHFSANHRPLGSDNLKDRFRIRMADYADALVCYTRGIANDLTTHLSVPEKVFVATNTLDTTELFAAFDKLQAVGRKNIRSRLELPADKPVVLFTGRLIKSKGTDVLIDTFRLVAARHPGATLVVIGDGPERTSMEQVVWRENLSVRFLGAITSLDDSAPYIYSSDVLVNPGYLGLSVNHAFALGVPVIAPAAQGDGRFHSPEWEFVQDGRNGILTADASTESLAQATFQILDNRESFSKNAFEYARKHLTVEEMVSGLDRAIRYAHENR